MPPRFKAKETARMPSVTPSRPVFHLHATHSSDGQTM
jgi:hypothetical protein